MTKRFRPSCLCCACALRSAPDHAALRCGCLLDTRTLARQPDVALGACTLPVGDRGFVCRGHVRGPWKQNRSSQAHPKHPSGGPGALGRLALSQTGTAGPTPPSPFPHSHKPPLPVNHLAATGLAQRRLPVSTSALIGIAMAPSRASQARGAPLVLMGS